MTVHLCCRGCGKRIAVGESHKPGDSVRWDLCGIVACARHEATRRKLRADLEGVVLP